ncbi:hypothetical protein [Oceanihabitans sediminis]|uniref:hypothetical protein n=1 Tax=Oceanihabitans sediminis TaxID=1812012 RepID=UPI00299DFD7E|nr:hypothetical protein [Oceanihabitans sediminis]MDX1278775.1 hypothetical protein [Oceanihabitans sediminis]MDX1773821.1 hypothetical protein [Oceanihabitans sediminis]
MNTEDTRRKSCQKASLICDKVQYQEATFFEKTKLLFHILMCRMCRKYTQQNKKLTQSINKAQVTCMQKQEKETLKETLSRAIQEQQS